MGNVSSKYGEPILCLVTYQGRIGGSSKGTRWYTDFEQFLEVNSLLDKPHCSKTVTKVAFLSALRQAKFWLQMEQKLHVYITPLATKRGRLLLLYVSINECCWLHNSTYIIMHIFAGVRFSYNPMHRRLCG